MQTTYTQAREHLAGLMDKVVNDREIVIIERRRKPSVALIAADELASLRETAYLLRSPKNAERLLSALEWSKTNDLKQQRLQTTEVAIADLKQELGIVEEKKD